MTNYTIYNSNLFGIQLNLSRMLNLGHICHKIYCVYFKILLNLNLHICSSTLQTFDFSHQQLLSVNWSPKHHFYQAGTQAGNCGYT